MGVLDKAVTVLDALAAGPRSLGELVSSTGLPRATAHRLAVADHLSECRADLFHTRPREAQFPLCLRSLQNIARLVDALL